MKITLPTGLGLLFIALKLMGYVTWPWLWVLAPFWVGAIIAVIVFIGLLALAIKVGE